MKDIKLRLMGDRVKLHVKHRGKRTTVVVDALMYEYFTMAIGKHPDESDARKAAEQWLNERMECLVREKPSELARYLMTAKIAHPELENQIQKQRL